MIWLWPSVFTQAKKKKRKSSCQSPPLQRERHQVESTRPHTANIAQPPTFNIPPPLILVSSCLFQFSKNLQPQKAAKKQQTADDPRHMTHPAGAGAMQLRPVVYMGDDRPVLWRCALQRNFG